MLLHELCASFYDREKNIYMSYTDKENSLYIKYIYIYDINMKVVSIALLKEGKKSEQVLFN